MKIKKYRLVLQCNVAQVLAYKKGDIVFRYVTLDQLLDPDFRVIGRNFFKILAKDAFIGIPDVNGDEVYEGDKVRMWSDLVMGEYEVEGVIKYIGCGFFVDWGDGAREVDIEAHIEIIGNIHKKEEVINLTP